ncbi:MAG: transposase [Syntrophomonadaceae bacterium]|nr:transposase [Syntrophomonadaceae bacterium]
MLEYKSKWYGSNLWSYPSSKTCGECGYVLPELKLSTRNWTCPECGVYHDTDVKALVNLLRYLDTA